MKLEGGFGEADHLSTPETEEVESEKPFRVALMDNHIFIRCYGLLEGAVVILRCLSNGLLFATSLVYL